MQTNLKNQYAFLNILTFLEHVQHEVNSLEELLDAIRNENKRIRFYEEQHQSQLKEIIDYQKQLEKVEKKLNSPSPIKIRFLPEGARKDQPVSTDEKAEAFLLHLLLRFIRGNNPIEPMYLVQPSN
jgi:predicted nuclease with TOPRIM domain